VHQKNALIIDTTDFEQCFNALEQLITNADLRKRLMHQAMRDISGFHPEQSAYRILEQLWA
jgi:hypothetical protein